MAHARDHFHAWILLGKAGNIAVQMLVVKFVDHILAHYLFKLIKPHFGRILNQSSHRNFNSIIVAVARGVVAFAKNLQVGGGVKIVAMQAMAGGKFKRLRHGGVIGHGNLVEE